MLIHMRTVCREHEKKNQVGINKNPGIQLKLVLYTTGRLCKDEIRSQVIMLSYIGPDLEFSGEGTQSQQSTLSAKLKVRPPYLESG